MVVNVQGASILYAWANLAPSILHFHNHAVIKEELNQAPYCFLLAIKGSLYASLKLYIIVLSNIAEEPGAHHPNSNYYTRGNNR